MTTKNRPTQKYAKDDPRYQPTKDETEEDVSIPDATPEELALAVVGRHPRRTPQHPRVGRITGDDIN